MNYFFGHNGYRVIDRNSVAPEDVTFANVWGACDEDLFRWTLREADAAFARGKPFHHFVMTTSNHRPYTSPEGRIDLPSKVSGRAGAVKYTDYAIGRFIRDASTWPWFHIPCSSSWPTTARRAPAPSCRSRTTTFRS